MRSKSRVAAAPPPAAMLDLITGYWISQLVYVAARLGLADLLARGSKTPTELARRTNARPDALRRVLRALAGAGVVREVARGRYTLTPLGDTLRTEHPASMRNFAMMAIEGYNWEAWGRLIDGVCTRRVPFESVHGQKVFEYYAAHPRDARVFGESMASISGLENAAVAAAYDFSKVRTLVDVGGSHGHLLAAILRVNPRLQGVLFDQRSVVKEARKKRFVTAPDVAPRVALEAGSFFERVPAGADAYLMKYILHDWPDAQCVRILANCRKAMAPRGRVLVVDTVIPTGNRPHWGKMLDINMLVITGGRERTRDEFRALFEAAGLRLARVIPTTSPLSVIEGVAAR